MTSVVFSIGSNLGDRAEHLRFAVRRLAEFGEVAAVSGVYETPPWGDTEQPAYYNAVVLMTGAHSVEEWLLHAHQIEHEAGRVRHQARRYSPRTLDVDLVAAWTDEGGPILRTTPELTLPHPHAHQRAFVLRPWLEVQPYAQLPGHGWVNDLVLADAMAAEVAAMTALPEVRLEVES